MINIKHVKRYCKDDIALIENYSEAINSPEMWVCHHRLETTLNGEAALSYKELIRLGMYYKRPYFELIFMKVSEHQALHSSIRIWSEASREKNRQSHIGKPNNTKGRIKSEEERKHISEALKGHKLSEESKLKISMKCKGKIPWNKGKKHSEEARLKISLKCKGRIPWNKGKRLKLC